MQKSILTREEQIRQQTIDLNKEEIALNNKTRMIKQLLNGKDQEIELMQ